LFTAPQQVLLSVETSNFDAISKVEYFSDNQKIGERSNPPFDFVWQALAGEHVLTATAIDRDGAATDSDAVPVFVSITNTAAQYLGEDSVTQGNWKDTYGTLGYNLIGHFENYPFFVTTLASGNRDFLWNNSTTDIRALQHAFDAGRIAACWVSSTNFLVDLLVGDDIPRKVSFYCLDWDGYERKETFIIRDSETGAVLDTETVSDFHGGKYLSWSLRGHVTIEVKADVGNAVLSGLFFDSEFTPLELWKWLQFSPAQLDDPNFSGDMADPDQDGIPNLLEYAYGFNPLAAERELPFKARLAGNSIEITFQRAIAASDLTFTVERSDDLVSWHPAEGLLDEEEDTGAATILVHYRLPVDSASQQFLRLRIQPSQ
jgi:hypothetical protein